MPEPKNKSWKWIPPRDGILRNIYANVALTSWTLFDVRVRLGQLIPASDYEGDFVIEEQGTVTFSWHEAKILRDGLNDLLMEYEKANGELKQQKLTPAPVSFGGGVKTPEDEK
ncbi:MAG TPA: DUF3467 domain-containing protein [Candidatus Angelobacter sp.]|jgi:hypothetical protein